MRSSRRARHAGLVALVGALAAASGCGPPAGSKVSVAETCHDFDTGAETHRDRQVAVSFTPSVVTAGQEFTATIDIEDFDDGYRREVAGEVDIMLPLPDKMVGVTSFRVGPSPVSAYWSASLAGRSVHLAYRPPVHSLVRVAGVPPVIISGRAASLGTPGTPAPWPVHTSYETFLFNYPPDVDPEDPRLLKRWVDCKPDDPNQPLGTFTVNDS